MYAIPFLLCRGQFTLRLLQHVTCSLSFPRILFSPWLGCGFDTDIATSHPLLLRFGGTGGKQFLTWKLHPHVSDVETGYIIEFGPSQRKRNASHLHQIISNWGGAGRTTLR